MTGALGKMMVDIMMYQMYASMILWWLSKESPHVAGTLLCLAAAVLLSLPDLFPALQDRKRRRLLLAGAVAVLLCELLMKASAAQQIAYTPLAVYLIVQGSTQKWYLDYEERRELFGKSFLGWILVPAVSLLMLHDVADMLRAVLPWTLVYMVLGVVHLRLLRDSADGEKNRGKLLRQFLELTAFLLLCFILEVTGLFQMALNGLRSLWLYALMPFLMALINVVSWLLSLLPRWKGKGMEEGVLPAQRADELEHLYYEIGGQSDVTVGIWPMIIIIAGIILLIVLLRKAMGRRGRKAEDGVEESTESLDGNAAHRRRRFISRNPAQAVRYCFARYMQQLKKKGETLEAADTSRRLADKGIRQMPEKEEAIERLRELYLKVRYRSEADCTKQDKKEAVSLWKEISR